jgi:hypothetical protein
VVDDLDVAESVVAVPAMPIAAPERSGVTS